MSHTISPTSIESIAERIAPLRTRLTGHPLYRALQTEHDLQRFMESHVFAVWDFMSLLKALQSRLTCVSVPWFPSPWPESRRFINEIVLGEESDVYQGRAISHFELYLQAMEESGADTTPIRYLLAQSARGSFQLEHYRSLLTPPAFHFIAATFQLIETGSLPALAAAFTFGREDVIPAIFRQLVRDLEAQAPGKFTTFIWYLERHIEVDGDDHGPLSLRMVADLCGTGEQRWEEATAAAEAALQARLALWDGILQQTAPARNF